MSGPECGWIDVTDGGAKRTVKPASASPASSHTGNKRNAEKKEATALEKKSAIPVYSNGRAGITWSISARNMIVSSSAAITRQ